MMFVLVSIAIGEGCSYPVHRPPESPYKDSYNNLFKDVKMPSTNDVLASGRYYTFSRPIDEVWAAILHIGSQYEGILGVNRLRESHRQLFVVHGQEVDYRPPRIGLYKNKRMEMRKFLDAWFVINVQSDRFGEKTSVTMNLIPPNREAVDYFEPVKSKSPLQISNTVCKGGSIFLGSNGKQRSPSENQSQLFSELTGNKEQQTLKLWKEVPSAEISEFFYELVMQLYCAPIWKKRFTKINFVSAGRNTHSIEHNSYNKEIWNNEEILRIEKEAGIWISAKMRRSHVIIHAPTVIKRLQKIIDELKTAANQEQAKITPYIVASPEINARAIPPGDIFINSGLINALNSSDELAAVLAHEIDHLFQHDAAAKLLERDKIGKKSFLANLITVSGAAGIGVNTGIVDPTPGTSNLSSIVRGISLQGANAASLSIAESLGNGMFGEYSENTELRADRNSTSYLLAAGYDVCAALRMLGTLKKNRNSIVVRKEIARTHPHLDTRIKKMGNSLKESCEVAPQ
uniref:Peptidase family M48 n=1 Tax=Candidatus Kentrum sp. LFY TaxID=2126342 RepID=A0A450WUZ9_9GAMM|nr:MAG: Peptidase family M48 [Candidatus Kentron sp. LFY]